jgi:YbbR domain-containing protein
MKQNLPSILISLLLAVGAWIFITLSGDFYITSKIPVVYSNLPPNLIVDHSLPREIEVKLKGQGWKLISFFFNSDKRFTIPVSKDSINSGVYLANLLDENSWLSTDFGIIDIQPPYLSIKTEKVEISQKNVVPELTLQFEQGFGLADKIKITPSSVGVRGSAKIVSDIRQIKTVRTTLKGLKEKMYIEVNLEGIKGVEIYPQKVTLEIDVQKIADREIEGVKITVLDKPEGKEVVLVPDEVTVVIRGGIERIGLIKPEEVKALLNYNEMIRDSSGTTVPNIVLPDNVSFVDVKPARIRYIIKQY